MNTPHQRRPSLILGFLIGLCVLCWMAPVVAAPLAATGGSSLPGSEVIRSTPAESDTEMAQPSGAEIFEVHCAGCHVNGGNIIRRGKNLKMRALRRYSVDSVEAIAHLVTVGKRPMSAYADTLTPAEIDAVSRYVLEQAEQGWK
jgi:cytochrome c6